MSKFRWRNFRFLASESNSARRKDSEVSFWTGDQNELESSELWYTTLLHKYGYHVRVLQQYSSVVTVMLVFICCDAHSNRQAGWGLPFRGGQCIEYGRQHLWCPCVIIILCPPVPAPYGVHVSVRHFLCIVYFPCRPCVSSICFFLLCRPFVLIFVHSELPTVLDALAVSSLQFSSVTGGIGNQRGI